MRLAPLRATVSVIAISLALANCANLGNTAGPCGDRPWACFLAAAGVVAAVAYIGFYSDDYGGDSAGSGGNYVASDARLKRDIAPAGVLPNGVKLYSFRYWNDERTFVGVMAQDLIADARFAHAVRTDESGYHLVNLKALGLGIQGDVEQFHAAASAALDAAKAL